MQISATHPPTAGRTWAPHNLNHVLLLALEIDNSKCVLWIFLELDELLVCPCVYPNPNPCSISKPGPQNLITTFWQFRSTTASIVYINSLFKSSLKRNDRFSSICALFLPSLQIVQNLLHFSCMQFKKIINLTNSQLEMEPSILVFTCLCFALIYFSRQFSFLSLQPSTICYRSSFSSSPLSLHYNRSCCLQPGHVFLGIGLKQGCIKTVPQAFIPLFSFEI